MWNTLVAGADSVPGTGAGGSFEEQISEQQRPLHLLNRLSFGPRPGEADRVRRKGIEKWIEEQLHPDEIPVNPVLTARLEPLDSLRMSDQEIAEHYPSSQLIRAMAMGKEPLPEDPELQVIVEHLIERYRNRKDGNRSQPSWREYLAAMPAEQRRILLWGTPRQKVKLLLEMKAGEFADLLTVLPRKKRRALFAYAPVELRRRMLMVSSPQQVVINDLIESKLCRAVYSDRQLEEVLTDFWFNHFNVYLNKGPLRQLTTTYERDAIRPHVLGKFGGLLRATAQHPAMLYYLDNWLSADPKAVEKIRARRPNALRNIRGLNENYGRELLELHTLGVDGGYTQEDVIAVARCFTGWSVHDLRHGGGFEFHARLHDREEKQVLGYRISPGGGIEDGMKVLDILARHPSTARFVSTKLAQRFVADHPPESLIETMAWTFQKTGGDLREVMRAMLASREFFSVGAWRGKVKSPLELVVSSVRALGARVEFATGLAEQIEQMGEPLYRKEEPTGYSNSSDAWMSSATLVARLNFAFALAANRQPGVKVDRGTLRGGHARIALRLLGIPPSESTLAAIENGGNGRPVPPLLAAGAILGSPEFQRR